MALDVCALKLIVTEYKRLQAADAEKIQEMGVRLKSLRAVARYEAVVDIPISSPIRGTLIVRDSSAVTVQRIKMRTPSIQLSGTIEKKYLPGRIYLPVTLHQAVWIEYKRRWIFWKKVKAVHQTITCNNPYVEILYSEYIVIGQ